MRAQASGFTLIEVLIALVIVALAAAAAMEAVSGAADEATRLRDRSFAQWIALNQIAEQRLQTTRPANGETKGTVEFAGQRWEWKQIIQPMELNGLRRLDVSVRPVSAGTDTPNYLVTATGVLGAAVAAPKGDEPDWEPAGAPQGPQAPQGPNGNPNAPGTPVAPRTGT